MADSRLTPHRKCRFAIFSPHVVINLKKGGSALIGLLLYSTGKGLDAPKIRCEVEKVWVKIYCLLLLSIKGET